MSLCSVIGDPFTSMSKVKFNLLARPESATELSPTTGTKTRSGKLLEKVLKSAKAFSSKKKVTRSSNEVSLPATISTKPIGPVIKKWLLFSEKDVYQIFQSLRKENVAKGNSQKLGVDWYSPQVTSVVTTRWELTQIPICTNVSRRVQRFLEVTKSSRTKQRQLAKVETLFNIAKCECFTMENRWKTTQKHKNNNKGLVTKAFFSLLLGFHSLPFTAKLKKNSAKEISRPFNSFKL